MGWGAVIGAGIQIIGSIAGSRGASKAANYSDAAYEAQVELNELELEREKRRLESEAQVHSANMDAAAAAQGIESSSLQTHSEQALQTQLNTELEYLDQRAELSSEIAYYQSKAGAASAKGSATSGIFGAIGGIVGSLF